MGVPLLDLKAQYRELQSELDAAWRECMGNAAFIGGPKVAALEREIAEYCGTDHAVACANGTDALFLILAAAGIGKGDEVITTPFTFWATVEAIAARGRYAGLRRHRAGHVQHGRHAARGGRHPAHQGDHAGAHLRPVRGHGRRACRRREARADGLRGCLSGDRRDVQGQACGFARPERLRSRSSRARTSGAPATAA